jgi:DNA-binding MarR family transcriptional regulator
MSSPLPPLDAMVGHQLQRAAARAMQHLAVALEPFGVAPGEWIVLRTLYDAGPSPPSVLADRCHLTRGAVTKLVDRLRAKQLVVRAAAGRDDRRYQTIALTGAGARLLTDLAAAAAASDAALFGHLSERDRARLRALAGRGEI